MSSYLSQPYNAQQAQQSVNVDLVGQTLSTLQNRYTQNKSIIDQTLAKYEMLKGLSTTDNEYISTKVREAESAIDAYSQSNGDLSRNTTRDTMLSAFKSIYKDPIVLNAIEQKTKYDTFNAEVAKRKEKGDGSYSDQNYGYSLYKGGVQDYMDGKTKKLGDLSYVPYTDYNKKINEFVKDLEGKKKGEVIQYRDNAGTIIETTIDGLSPTKLRQIAKSMLDVNDLKQVEIDGWANTNGYQNKERVFSEVGGKIDSYINEYETEITKLEVQNKNGGLSTEQKSQNESLIQSYRDNIDATKKNKEVLTQDIATAATFLQKESVLDNVVNRFSPLYTESKVYKKDEPYFAIRSDRREEAKLLIDQENLQISRDKLKLEKDIATGKFSAENAIIVPKPTTDMEDVDVESDINKTVVGLSTEINAVSMSFKNRITELAGQGDKEAKTVLDDYNKYLKQGKSENEAFTLAVESNVDSGWDLASERDSNGNYFYQNLTDKVQKRDTYIFGKAELDKKAEEEHFTKTVDNQATFSAFYNNPNTKMLWQDTKGNPTSVSIAKILIDNGIMDKNGKKIKDINNFPKLKESLIKSYYADAILSATQSQYDLRKKSLEDLARILGEDPNKVIRKAKNQIYAAAPDVLSPIEGTKLFNYLATAESKGIYDTVLSKGYVYDKKTGTIKDSHIETIDDNSLSNDDSTINNFLRKDYRKDENYRKGLKDLWGKLPQGFSVGIAPTDKATFNRIKDYINTEGATTSIKGDLSEDNTFSISLDATGSNVILTQYDTEGSGKDKKTVTFQTTTDKNTFKANFQSLVSKMDLDSPQAHYTKERTKVEDLTTKSIKFNINETSLSTINRVKEQAGLRAQEPITIQETDYVIGAPIKSIYGKDSEEFLNYKKAMEQSSNFSIQGVPDKFGEVLKLNLVNSKGDIVYTKEQAGIKNFDNLKKVIDYAPQALYADMLYTIFLEDQRNSKSLREESSATYLNFVKNLK